MTVDGISRNGCKHYGQQNIGYHMNGKFTEVLEVKYWSRSK